MFILKGKTLLFFFVFILVMGIFAFGTAEVFLVNNRNIPVYSVEREDNRASITFNCAWNDDDIDDILATLKKYNVKATFFIVGNWAEKYPESLKKIHSQGHEIGSHSYNHKDYAAISADEITNDIKKCDNVIKNIIGIAPKLLRVPSGSYNNNAISAIEQNEKIAIQWSADSIDYNDASADDIYQRSIKLEHGGILLMHNGTKNTAIALDRVLDNLSKRFELVLVSDLLYDDNFKLDVNGRMHKTEN